MEEFSWDTGLNSMTRTPDDDANMLLGCSQEHQEGHGPYQIK